MHQFGGVALATLVLHTECTQHKIQQHITRSKLAHLVQEDAREHCGDNQGSTTGHSDTNDRNDGQTARRAVFLGYNVAVAISAEIETVIQQVGRDISNTPEIE